ncbi:hypothetical protein GRZ55_11085 [Chelativorans sp. ZYF759]|uniref:hypothetical protein n=1 Tax=Chelativorans sp. ZYF759 TaxID=2692213 RepID=UPI00145C54E5|nr:hypothetical protein [Chelativorans sp. ZYF759]NMG39787.1 hypothetical protein [Chelativorans sp. ZYF759]
MDLLNLIPGGGVTAGLALVATWLAGIVAAFLRGRRAGLDTAKAKEAEAHERELSRTRKAADARSDAERRARAGELSDEWTRDD